MITENLSTLTIHKLSQKQYNRELAAGNIDASAMYLTPDVEKICCSLIPEGNAIVSNSDLNTIDFMSVGTYHCPENVTVATLSNCPTSSGFMMHVYSPLSSDINNESTKTWIYRLRKITTYTGVEYTQYCHVDGTAGNWIFGAWRQTVKSSANIAQNSFLVGDGTNNMIEKTPAEVLSLLGISYGDTLPTAGTAGRIFFKKV